MSELLAMYAAQVNSPYTTTLGEISATDTSVSVSDASVLPVSVPFLLTFGFDKSAAETVLVTAKNGNTLTITRGVDGNALLWVAGTKCARTFTAKDLNDIQTNINRLNNGKQEKITASGLLKGNGSGGVSPAVAGTDYAAPSSVPSASTAAPKANGTASAGSSGAWSRGDHVHPTDTTRQAKITANGLLKGNGAGGVSAAQAGADYSKPAISFSLALPATGWSNKVQTVANANIHAAGYVYVVAPDPDNFVDYAAATVRAEDVTTDGAMTFTCEDVPSVALTVSVIRLEATNG